MPSNCIFELNKPQGIYFSGETVSGTINLTTTKSKNVRDICIIFLGEGKVNWQERHSVGHHNGVNMTSTRFYSSHEVYVNNATYVYGEGVLPPGQHIYTFAIPLPLDCPSSIESEYGYIRYDIILKINRYYHFDNIYKKMVTIIKTFDLNFDPTFKLPAEGEVIKNVCCWPCSKGKIMCNLIVPFGAYAPQQTIKYSLQINNQSMSDIESFVTEFIKKITFTAKSPQHKQRHIKEVLFSRKMLQTSLRLSNRKIEGEIPIPSITTTTSHSYDIIFVEYKLKVILNLSGCSKNPKISVPIVIGTIPIRESLAHITQPQTVQTAGQVKDIDLQKLPINTDSNFGKTETAKPQALQTSEYVKDINVQKSSIYNKELTETTPFIKEKVATDPNLVKTETEVKDLFDLKPIDS
ncbi:arrestin domain-containing protein 3-like isoform 1-T1 [Cochliomyia hominivorax]